MAASASSSSPVFLFLKSKQCTHCYAFQKAYWDILHKGLLELRPDIRIENVIYNTFDPDSYDQSKYPQGLVFWGKVYPSFILVPGDVWDKCVKDRTATMNTDDGAEGMNLAYRNNQLLTSRGYNYDDKGVLKWVAKTLEKPSFNVASTKNSKDTAAPVVVVAPTANLTTIPQTVATIAAPTVPSSIIFETKKAPVQGHQGIKVVSKTIVPHGNHSNRSNGVATTAPATGTVWSNGKSAAKVPTHDAKESNVGINVCNIRLVSRPPNR